MAARGSMQKKKWTQNPFLTPQVREEMLEVNLFVLTEKFLSEK